MYMYDQGFIQRGGPWDLPPQQEFPPPPQDFENYVIIALKQGSWELFLQLQVLTCGFEHK